MPDARTWEAANATQFDAWEASGRGESMADGHTELVDRILARWGALDGASVLDVGCGVGKALAAAAQAGAGSLAGIDVAPRMIENAKARLPGADLRVSGAAPLPFDDASFDAVLSIESLYYHPDPKASLAEIVRVLKSGGRFATAIELYTDCPGAHGWIDAMEVDVHLWSEAEWAQAAREAGLVDVQTERLVRQHGLKVEEDFEASAYFKTYQDYLAYRHAGALAVYGRRP